MQLKLRVLSSIIFLLILMAGIHFGGQSALAYIVMLVLAISSLELYKLVFKSSYFSIRGWLFFLSINTCIFVSWKQPNLLFFYVFLIFTLSCGIELFLEQNKGAPQFINSIQKHFFGIGYIGLLGGLCLQLLWLDQLGFWFYLLLATVFCGDIFAYFFGWTLGKTKLHPFSPGKTRLGALGGLLGSVTGGSVLWYLMKNQMPHPQTLWFLLMAGIFAQIGDLVESALKRSANVKNSGKLMPGHGGLLDRIDGILFGAPIIAILSLFS